MQQTGVLKCLLFLRRRAWELAIEGSRLASLWCPLLTISLNNLIDNDSSHFNPSFWPVVIRVKRFPDIVSTLNKEVTCLTSKKPAGLFDVLYLGIFGSIIGQAQCLSLVMPLHWSCRSLCLVPSLLQYFSYFFTA